MTYRPTVRYDNYFREYVDELFQATHLDRNQIMRAALFFLGSESLSKNFLAAHLVKGKTLPLPLSVRYPKHDFFMANAPKTEGGRDVSERLEGGTSAPIKLKSMGISYSLGDSKSQV